MRLKSSRAQNWPHSLVLWLRVAILNSVFNMLTGLPMGLLDVSRHCTFFYLIHFRFCPLRTPRKTTPGLHYTLENM